MNASNNSDGFVCLFDGMDAYCEAIVWIRRLVSLTSIVSSVLMFVMIVLFKKFRVFNQRLILNLAIASIFQSSTYFIDSYDAAGRNEGFCIFMGMLTQYSDWVAVLWICCVTFTVCVGIGFYKPTDKLEIPYHFICWGIPIVLTLLPLIEVTYGLAGLWCWIRSTKDMEYFPVGVAFQFTFYYGPIAIIAILIVVMSMTMIIIVHRRTSKYQGSYDPSKRDEIKAVLKQARSLYFYPWAFAILYTIPFINSTKLTWFTLQVYLLKTLYLIRQAAGATDAVIPVGLSFVLWFFHANTLPFLGTVYTVIFALDKETRSRLTWTNIKNAILCHNTSQVAQPYAINITVEDKSKTEPMTNKISVEENNEK